MNGHEAIKFVFKNFCELSATSQSVAMWDILLNDNEKTKYFTRFDDDATNIRFLKWAMCLLSDN